MSKKKKKKYARPLSGPLHHFHYSAVKYVINHSTANRESIELPLCSQLHCATMNNFLCVLASMDLPAVTVVTSKVAMFGDVTVHFELLDTQEFMFHSLGVWFQTKNFLMLTGVHKKAIHFSPMHPPISNKNQHTIHLHTIPLPTEPKHLPFVGHAHPTE